MNKDKVIQKIISDLKLHPNQDEVYMVSGHESKTYADVIYAMENKTEFGLNLIRNIENLNTDLIKRNRKPLWNE